MTAHPISRQGTPMTAHSGFPDAWLNNLSAIMLRNKLMELPASQILAVSLHSAPEEIKAAYAARAAQLRSHPDVTSASELSRAAVTDLLRLLELTRDLLVDPERRRTYVQQAREMGEEPPFYRAVEDFQLTEVHPEPPTLTRSGNPFSNPRQPASEGNTSFSNSQRQAHDAAPSSGSARPTDAGANPTSSARRQAARGANPFASSSRLPQMSPSGGANPFASSNRLPQLDEGALHASERSSDSANPFSSSRRQAHGAEPTSGSARPTDTGANPSSSTRHQAARGANPFASSSRLPQMSPSGGANPFASSSRLPQMRASDGANPFTSSSRLPQMEPPNAQPDVGASASRAPSLSRSASPQSEQRRVPISQQTPSPLRSSSSLNALSGSSVNPFLSGSHVAPSFDSPPNSEPAQPTHRPSGRHPSRPRRPLPSHNSATARSSSIIEQALEEARAEPSSQAQTSDEPAQTSTSRKSGATSGRTKKLTARQKRKQKRLAMFQKASAHEEGEPFEGPLAFGVGQTKRGLAHAGALFAAAFLGLLALGATGMGADEFKVTPDEPMIFVRSAFLLVLGAAGLLGLRREKVTRVGLTPELWPSLVCLPIAALIGLMATPIARLDLSADADLSVVLGLLAVRAVGEAVFFHGFITRTLLIELEDSTLALFISALMYGAYALTFQPIAEGAILNILFGVMVYGFGSGFPLAIMYWKTRSVLIPIVAQIIIYSTLAIVGLEQVAQFSTG